MPPSYAVLLGANEVPGLTPTGDRPTLNSIPVPLPSVFLMRSGLAPAGMVGISLGPPSGQPRPDVIRARLSRRTVPPRLTYMSARHHRSRAFHLGGRSR